MNLIEQWASFAPQLWPGLLVSLQVTGLALLLGIPGGLLFAVLASHPNKVVRWIIIGLVELGRGTPALVVLQIIYFGVPSVVPSLTLGSFVAAAIALALTTAAYTSEIIRGGLQAVPAGQKEAAAAMGMTPWNTLWDVVIPQGFRVAIPALIGFAVLIFQASALAYTISLPELLSRAYSIGSSTFQYLSVLILAGVFYLLITIPMSAITSWTERRLSRHL
ncbi:amino acid ABC transporter permease [Gulosibacter molinativorax]|uniref:Amino acid ABC transporter permease n=1 Tax=Gulosibacter molinativorax TaxID=256821 RepID=A0ABT7C7L3_9MICO|nr:amino acid ABC transporter permease [Gulosibacter molinativorax]MDJ1371164.1 amino acid ABC transporter permease [Gulosibacter molinativorax]QUY62980.1 Amino-acid ABC transporter permease protein YckA2 [Gulosibacter molinativorax]